MHTYRKDNTHASCLCPMPPQIAYTTNASRSNEPVYQDKTRHGNLHIYIYIYNIYIYMHFYSLYQCKRQGTRAGIPGQNWARKPSELLSTLSLCSASAGGLGSSLTVSWASDLTSGSITRACLLGFTIYEILDCVSVPVQDHIPSHLFSIFSNWSGAYYMLRTGKPGQNWA